MELRFPPSASRGIDIAVAVAVLVPEVMTPVDMMEAALISSIGAEDAAEEEADEEVGVAEDAVPGTEEDDLVAWSLAFGFRLLLLVAPPDEALLVAPDSPGFSSKRLRLESLERDNLISSMKDSKDRRGIITHLTSEWRSLPAPMPSTWAAFSFWPR